MTDNSDKQVNNLRKKAEDLLQKWTDEGLFSIDSVQSKHVLHELQVHQIELEIQNEELRRAQCDLEIAHLRFANLYNNAPVGYVVLNASGLITQVNMTFTRMICKDSNNVIGKPFADFIRDTDIPIFRARFRNFFQNPESKKIEIAMIKGPDQFFYARLEAATFENKTKQPEDAAKELLVTISDITDRKEAEQIIDKEREQLAVTLRCIGDGVITTDTAGNICLINTIAEKMTEWTQQEASGKPLTEVFNAINDLTRQAGTNPVHTVLQTSERLEDLYHTRLISRNNKEYYITINCAPIKNSKNVTIGTVLVFRDITEKQQLLEHMQRTEKLDSLGVLAGGLAHDFNNLLCGLFGYLDFARENCQIEDKHILDPLDRALGVFGRAKDLTQRLLTFSKGGAPLRKTGDIAQFVKKNGSFVLAGSNISCDYDIPDDIWQCEYDENQMGQVLDNIVMNALQAMPGGGKLLFKLRNRVIDGSQSVYLPQGPYVCISIIDHGIGIPPEIINRIFDPFFSTKQQGSGLGLTTCYSIIKKHDGHIEVESKPGSGTTFHIILPATTKSNVECNRIQKRSIDGSGTVLIMDDESFIREVAGNMLRKAGFDIIEASNGEEALKVCENAISKNVALKAAIFDLTVPGGMGGALTVIEMRKRYPAIPVFASSGYSEDPIMSHPENFGFIGSICKPFKKEELYEMLFKLEIR